jgi:hypothetical protein
MVSSTDDQGFSSYLAATANFVMVVAKKRRSAEEQRGLKKNLCGPGLIIQFRCNLLLKEFILKISNFEGARNYSLRHKEKNSCRPQSLSIYFSSLIRPTTMGASLNWSKARRRGRNG